MNKLLFTLIALCAMPIYSLEYEQKINNDLVTVSRVKIFPGEEIGLHRDDKSQVVIALQGGVITRLESDARAVDVEFPTGVAVFREPDPKGELHKSVNRSSKPVELIIIQLQNKESAAVPHAIE
jgi:hypothetical protein